MSTGNDKQQQNNEQKLVFIVITFLSLTFLTCLGRSEMLHMKELTHNWELVKSDSSGDQMEWQPFVLNVSRLSLKIKAQFPHIVIIVGNNSVLYAVKIWSCIERQNSRKPNFSSAPWKILKQNVERPCSELLEEVNIKSELIQTLNREMTQ